MSDRRRLAAVCFGVLLIPPSVARAAVDLLLLPDADHSFIAATLHSAAR